MKRFKLLFAVFAFSLSTAAFANTDSSLSFKEKRPSMSHQIEQMLSDSGLIIEDNFTVTVVFRVDEERKIQIRQIDSPNPKVNDFLKRRLENQKLYGNSWDSEKIYELPVKVQSNR